MQNPLLSRLIESGMTDEASLVHYSNGARDAENMPMVRCARTGAIFILEIGHATDAHYVNKAFDHVDNGFWGGPIDKFDLDRRTELLTPYVPGKHWLDFGCGFGDVLSTVGPFAKSVSATELNAFQIAHVQQNGFEVQQDISDFGGKTFDMVTMFHVLEHLPDPIGLLKHIGSHMSKNGRIVVEIPHARDFLLSQLECDAFKKFTLWSEHLVLHTRETLAFTLQTAGYKVQSISGVQRYPVSNHLHWASKDKPGGHEVFGYLNDCALNSAYAATLARIDATDTLVAVALKE